VPVEPPGVVVLLGDRSAGTAAVVHALMAHLDGRAALHVLLEESPSRLALARRRARKIGWGKVGGQVAFVGLVMPLLRWRGRHRVRQIVQDHTLDVTPVSDAVHVSSVNNEGTIALLRQVSPTVVVVHGTRIISRHVLGSVDVPVLNLHAGVTPRYRGVHGGYWAFRDGRPDLAGSTVHLVDPGIDTGGILAQTTFTPEPADSIATYPFLHLACAIPLLLGQVDTVLAEGRPETVAPLPGAEHSQLRWHPTAWDYGVARLRGGVR
jgi:Formyl transferase